MHFICSIQRTSFAFLHALLDWFLTYFQIPLWTCFFGQYCLLPFQKRFEPVCRTPFCNYPIKLQPSYYPSMPSKLATSKAAYQFVGIISAILFASCQKRGRLGKKRNYTSYLCTSLLFFRPLFFFKQLVLLLLLPLLLLKVGVYI